MILARAPLRTPLGGGGTDLPSYYSKFGGFILSAAINKYVYIAVNRPSADDYIRVKYSRYEQVCSPEQVEHDLVRPTLRLLGLDSNLEIVSLADVPDGTGLGSSSAYLVALLNALRELKRDKTPTQNLAENAFHIERCLAGHPVGKQDHYLAAFGGITVLEIASDGEVKVSPLHLSISALEDLRSAVLLFYTGQNRSSTTILRHQETDTQAQNLEVIDSLHRTKELGYRVKESLEKGDVERFGLLLDEHWQNKKRRSSHISDSRIDNWYQLARDSGALGGKIMGAGGGGFFMFCCPNGGKSKLRANMSAAGLREIKYDFEFEGSKIVANI
ncbi:MAG: galactokinase [Acidobacteria bacterium]|nr:galactokinase [Acidobacteriota bacterium]